MRGTGASISRRGAMRLLGATPLAAGVALSPAGVARSPAGGALGQEPAPPSPLPEKPYWIVRPDGSFDLVTPGVRLRNCYPAFDGVPLRVESVKVGAGPRGTEAVYRVADGGLVIRVGGRRGQEPGGGGRTGPAVMSAEATATALWSRFPDRLNRRIAL